MFYSHCPGLDFFPHALRCFLGFSEHFTFSHSDGSDLYLDFYVFGGLGPYLQSKPKLEEVPDVLI